ncbi:MAG: hypothetical protein ACFB16_23375 [Phormidesmis sp.]
MKSTSAFAPIRNQAYWPLPRLTRSASTKRPSANQLASSSDSPDLLAQLSRALQPLVSVLVGSSEPRVWHHKNAAGQTLWSAHDGASGRAISNVSETELRVWLESRY